MTNLALGIKPHSMEVDLTPNGNFLTTIRRKTGDWDDDTTLAIVFDEDTSWPATIVDDTATWDVPAATVAAMIEANPSEAQLVITTGGTPVVRGAGQINIGRSAPTSGVTLGAGAEIVIGDGPDQIIAVPVPGIKGDKGDKGDTGDPGTTDYDQLENLPDLTLKADKDALDTETSERANADATNADAIAGETTARADGDATITTALGSKADLVSGQVPAAQLPSYVDDVLPFANIAAFPATGEDGKIYVAKDTNLTYRWTGSAYGVLDPSLALGETSSTGYRGDRGKTAFDHSQTTGNPHGTSLADLGAQAVATLPTDVAAHLTDGSALDVALAGEITTAAGPIEDLSGSPIPGYRFRVVVDPASPTEIHDIIVEAI